MQQLPTKKNKHVPNVAKIFFKSNTSDCFSPLLPLKRAVDPLSEGIFPLQRDNPLTHTFPKQQANRTNFTDIGLVQSNLLGNRLQNKTLPFKETSNSLSVPSLFVGQKDKLLGPLPLQETLSSAETDVVAKDYPKISDAMNNSQSKELNLLAESKPKGYCTTTDIERLNGYNDNVKTGNNIQDCNASNIDDNVESSCVKNLTEIFKQKQNQALENRKSCERTPTQNVKRFEGAYIEHLHNYNGNNTFNNNQITYVRNIIKGQNKIKKITENIKINPLINIIYNNIEEIVKWVNNITPQYNIVLEMIQALKQELKVAKDKNIDECLIELLINNLTSLKAFRKKKYVSTDDKIKEIKKRLNDWERQYDEFIIALDNGYRSQETNKHLNSIKEFQPAIRQNCIDIIDTVTNIEKRIDDIMSIDHTWTWIDNCIKDLTALQEKIKNEDGNIDLIKDMIDRLELEENNIQPIVNEWNNFTCNNKNDIFNKIDQLFQDNDNVYIKTDQTIESIRLLTQDIIQQEEEKKTELEKGFL